MYKRKYKEKFPVIAICYDFDKTLSPKDMQAQGFIQDIGYDVNNFWEESNALAKANDMDTNLAYMYKMVEKSQGNFRLDKKILADYGAKVELFLASKHGSNAFAIMVKNIISSLSIILSQVA